MVQEITRGCDCRFVSMGGDNGMIDTGYIPVLRDKLRWSEYVGWVTDPQPLFVSMSREPGTSAVNTFNILLEAQGPHLKLGSHPDVDEDAGALTALLAAKECVE